MSTPRTLFAHSSVTLAAITLAGLGLRLLAWRWRELYGLGGDEQEYLNAAVALLRDRRYTELLFMRPPLYPVFLAAAIYAVDSLVQNLRLVQAMLSAATIPLVYLLTGEIARQSGAAEPRRPALLAALLAALSYGLATNATELLTETLFLFGLTAQLWLLLRAGRTGGWAPAALAGLALGALCLVRSVALPLLPLGGLWLAISAARNAPTAQAPRRPWRWKAARQVCALALACCAILLPWTARNYLTYGGPILIDTTGAENLWLDNDPAGREAVKAQLFALGDDRLARQRLASERGLAAILADPGWFAAKAGGELLKFFALEFSDDMRARPAIWVPPAEVWLRLLLGDGLWLLLLLAGGYGLARALLAGARRGGLSALAAPAWLLAPWALYVLLTTLIFHVELRYRLPLFPALLPYAALALAGGRRREAGATAWLAATVPALLLALTLAHANYPALALRLGAKHWQLARAEAALARADEPAARAAATAALARDDRSALARVALARADLLRADVAAALRALDAAIVAIPFHPHAHLLRGDLLRLTGDADAAREELGVFEAGSLQDLQRWSWERFVSPPPARLDLGDGLDLGFVAGFHFVREGEAGHRWTTGASRLRLSRPEGGGELNLRLASGRPDGVPTPVEVLVDGAPAGRLEVAPGWQEYRLPLPAAGGGEAIVELRSPTFRPRQFDWASPDGRALGVMVDWAAVEKAAEGTES